MASSSSHLTLSGCRRPLDTSLGSWRSHFPTSPSNSAKELRGALSTQVHNTYRGIVRSIYRHHNPSHFQRSFCPFSQVLRLSLLAYKYAFQSLKMVSQDGRGPSSCARLAGRVSFSQIDAFYSIRIIQMPVIEGERSDLGLFGPIRKCQACVRSVCKTSALSQCISRSLCSKRLSFRCTSRVSSKKRHFYNGEDEPVLLSAVPLQC